MNTFEAGKTNETAGRFPPFIEMTNVLMAAEKLPEEERKRLLRLENYMPNGVGGFRYDLLLGRDQQTGETYLALKTVHSNDMGVSFDGYEEAEWSIRTNPGRTPLRTGYLQITTDEIKEIRPEGLVEETTIALDDILKLHFPNHKLNIVDIDARGGDFPAFI